MKKRDFILLTAVLATALLLGGVLGLRQFLAAQNAGSLYAQIRIDGALYASYSLSEDREEIIESEYGRNVFRITDGGVTMMEADCPDGYCTEMAVADGVGETIVCLPHHLVIEITGEENTTEDITEYSDSGHTVPDIVAG